VAAAGSIRDGRRVCEWRKGAKVSPDPAAWRLSKVPAGLGGVYHRVMGRAVSSGRRAACQNRSFRPDARSAADGQRQVVLAVE
jgi:hypothetical protein